MALFLSFRYVILDCQLTQHAELSPQPFTMKFPRADIYELLTCDLLHQAIKGVFKDHLVEWVEEYLKIIHGSTKAEKILDEIDRRCVKSER